MGRSDRRTGVSSIGRRLFVRLRLRRLRRAQYRAVWNLLAATERDSKAYVAGYTSEAELRQSGEQTVAMLRDCVGVFEDDTVLEIGAGIGRVGAILAPLCKEWIGADVSDRMLGHLKRRLAGYGNVSTVLISGRDLAGVAADSVDLVYCTVVFMHLDEWERYSYIREGMRVLRTGGRMLVDNINLASDNGWELFVRTMNEYRPDQRPPHISKTSTPQELMTYFQRAGFSDIQQRMDSTWVCTYGVKAYRASPRREALDVN